MARASAVFAAVRDWRLVALVGAVIFAASFVLFHSVVPLTAWMSVAPMRPVSALGAGLVSTAAMTLTLAVLAQLSRLRSRRMHVALDNMSQAYVFSIAMSGWWYPTAATASRRWTSATSGHLSADTPVGAIHCSSRWFHGHGSYPCRREQ
jgi:hypothetical protein